MCAWHHCETGKHHFLLSFINEKLNCRCICLSSHRQFSNIRSQSVNICLRFPWKWIYTYYDLLRNVISHESDVPSSGSWTPYKNPTFCLLSAGLVSLFCVNVHSEKKKKKVKHNLNTNLWNNSVYFLIADLHN